MNNKKQLKILVIAPHPDDEVLGCGGTIAEYSKQGNEVYLLIVTKAYRPDWSAAFLKNRSKEIAKAGKILGIKQTLLLGFPTVKLDTVSQKTLNDKIQEVVNKIRPQTIYIPSGMDLNRDHRIVFESALVAARPKPGSSVKRILTYEVPSETDWGQPLGVFLPTVYEDISKELPTKLRAMAAYKSELKSFPHPRSLEGIKVFAKKRGMEAGMRAAEGFGLIREVIN